MKHLVVATLLLAASTPAISGKPLARSILAKHDHDGRLPNTKIERLGRLRVGRSHYVIYYLSFTNPASLHGQQRIAIIRNGREFMGAYQCTLGKSKWDATLLIRDHRLLVYMNDRPRNKQTPFVIRFTERGPTRNPYFCGEGSGWENSI